MKEYLALTELLKFNDQYENKGDIVDNQINYYQATSQLFSEQLRSVIEKLLELEVPVTRISINILLPKGMNITKDFLNEDKEFITLDEDIYNEKGEPNQDKAPKKIYFKEPNGKFYYIYQNKINVLAGYSGSSKSQNGLVFAVKYLLKKTDDTMHNKVVLFTTELDIDIIGYRFATRFSKNIYNIIKNKLLIKYISDANDVRNMYSYLEVLNQKHQSELDHTLVLIDDTNTIGQIMTNKNEQPHDIERDFYLMADRFKFTTLFITQLKKDAFNIDKKIKTLAEYNNEYSKIYPSDLSGSFLKIAKASKVDIINPIFSCEGEFDLKKLKIREYTIANIKNRSGNKEDVVEIKNTPWESYKEEEHND